MEIIACEDIQAEIIQLETSFKKCSKVKKSDLLDLLNLIKALNDCNNEGGLNYDTLVTNMFEPVLNQVVTYPIDTFHSISIMVLDGSITYNLATLPTGTTLNLEVTTLNQTPFTFTVTAGSKLLVQYLIVTP